MNEAPPILDPIPPAPDPPPPPAYRDRRTGLICFGALQLFLSILTALMAAIMVVGQTMMSHQTGVPTDVRLLIPAILFYCSAAIGFGLLGFGSIKCRRWARSLTLVMSWCWLLVGLFSVPMLAWLMPKVLAGNVGPRPLPGNMITVVIIVQLAFVGLFFILLPSLFLFFYGNRHVRATCEARDPVPRWTDACPLPLLLVACVCWSSAMLMLPMASLGLIVIPFFGTLIAGIPGAVLAIGLGALVLWIGRAWYQSRIEGWWALLGLIVVFVITSFVTFSRIEIVDLYRAMNYPQAHIDLIQRQGWMSKGFVVWSCAFWGLPCVAYLLWAKRYF